MEKSHKNYFLPLILVLFFSLNSQARDTEYYYSPKVGVRFSSGMLVNKGPVGGSTFTYGGMNVFLQYYLTSSFSAGIGYKMEFDYASGTIPLRGLDFSSRYYVWGKGTNVIRKSGVEFSQVRDRLALYMGMGISQRDFYAYNPNAKDDDEKNIVGTYGGISLNPGIDFYISRHLELNIEGDVGVFTFAESNFRYRILPYLVYVGVSFVY